MKEAILTVRLTKEENELLERWAKHLGWTKSEVFRRFSMAELQRKPFPDK